MADAQDYPNGQHDQKRTFDVGDPKRRIEEAQGAVQADCHELEEKIKRVAEKVEAIRNDVVRVGDKVEGTRKIVQDSRHDKGRQILPAVTMGLVIVTLVGVVIVFFSTPGTKAVAQDVAQTLLQNDEKGKAPPAVNPKDIADIQTKVNALQTWANTGGVATKADLRAALVEVRNETLKHVGTGPAPGGGLDKKIDALEKTVAGYKADLPLQIRDQLLPLRDALAKGGPDTKGVEQQLARLTSALTEQSKRLDAMEARLGAALRLPKEDNLAPVLFVLEGGGRMLDCNHEAARSSLLRALEESVRQTPDRPFGLLLTRGKEVAQPLLKLSKHDATQVAELQVRQEPLVPNPNVEVAWERACSKAIDDVLLRSEPRKRIVYLTCSPPTEAKFDAAGLAKQAAGKGVEVWVVHLVRGGTDGPSRDLATLATETGGSYLVVPSFREESPRQKQAGRRLESALFDALDLRVPESK